MRALELAGGKTPLRLFYGVSRCLEALGEPRSLSSQQISDFSDLDPPQLTRHPGFLLGLPWGLFEKDGIGFRLTREFAIDSDHLPVKLEFGQHEDDGAQILDWLNSGHLTEWIETVKISIHDARAFLEAERHTKPRVNSLEKLYQELHLSGSVALCYWHHGVPFPRYSGGFLPGPWHRLSSLKAITLLRETLLEPRYLVDFAWARKGYHDTPSTDLPVLLETVKLCRQLNVIPQLVHLGWSAASLIAHPEQTRLLQALRPEIYGRLPDSPLSLKWGRLYTDGCNLLAPEDPYHKAESLLGIGRVNRWIQLGEAKLRVHAEAGAVDRIELEP